MKPLIEAPGYDRHRAINCVVFNQDAHPQPLENLDEISDVLDRGDRLVWLDLAQPSPDDLALLQREFNIHPVAIEDVALWHERPKIEFFEHYVLVIVHAATLDGDGNLVTHEIAILAGDRYVVTLRAVPVYSFDELQRRRSGLITVPHDSTGLLYIILDTIVDGYFPITERFDDRLVRLESRLFDTEKFTGRTEHEIFQFKRSLTLFRSLVTPTREILLRLMHNEIEPLKPGLTVYFRDVHDHVMRALEQIDITRDLVNSTLDIHLSMQTHRQNEVSKQLTIIATIFLPLTYITGFFGQNFGWMVNSVIANPESFWWLGIGTQIVTVVALFAYFRHKRWF